MTVDKDATESGNEEVDVQSTAVLEDDLDAAEPGETDAELLEPSLTSPGRAGVSAGTIVGALLLAVAFVASAALASVLYFTLFRHDQQTDEKAQQSAIQAATDGTVALLSYTPDTLDKDFANAKSHLTGDFLSYYTDFTTKVVTPAAQQKKVTTNAKVVQAAVAEIAPDSAAVLLFINQTTTSQEIPDGSFAISSVKVGLTKNDGRWLISSFDPV